MHDRVVEVASTVIQKADAKHPADALLRAELRAGHEVPAELNRETAQAVFAYYRWFGWLNPKQPIAQQLELAGQLAERFRRNPGSFALDELRAKAVPAWVRPHLNVPADWVRTLQAEPNVWLRARPGTGPQLAQRLGDCHPAGDDLLADALIYSGEQDLFRTPEFHRGEFELQDISSQAVGLICRPQPDEKWWDACAGEGGKLLHLADLMQNKGLIWASDRAAWRLAKLKRRAARARVFNYRTVPWTGGTKLPTRTRFHGVLVDAPCSGIGTWQRNPQARWTMTLADIEELSAAQERLLAHVVPALAEGGRLVYSVCTLSWRETTAVADSITARFPELRPLPVNHPFGATAEPSAQHWIWPEASRGNGMFIAIWERKH